VVQKLNFVWPGLLIGGNGHQTKAPAALFREQTDVTARHAGCDGCCRPVNPERAALANGLRKGERLRVRRAGKNGK
jgi:hypothetical protein